MRLLITGVSGYLGAAVMRALDEDPAIDAVVGVDLKPPAVAWRKLDFRQIDVRDREGMREAMRGSDAALHLAFILDEIRDKRKIYDININGSKNVFHACLDTGTSWIILVSSMAAFGAHPDNPLPLREEDYPRGDPRCYYSYSKAEVEHYLARLHEDHPELETTILRPCVIAGENMDNTVSYLFARRIAASPRGLDPHTQLIHEEDLARAIQLVLHRRATGIYHLTSDDTIAMSEMLRRAGIIAPPLPVEFLCRLMDAVFWLRLSPISSHWINMFRHSMVGSNEKIKRELGWHPSYTSRELFEEVLRAGRKGKRRGGRNNN